MERSAAVMRIALCTDGVFPDAMGGMQRHSRLLAEHLARIPGVELAVLHPHERKLFDPGLGIHEVHVSPMDARRLYLRELHAYSARIAMELDRLQPSLILSQGFSVWKGIRRFTPRLVVMPHGLEMFQGLTVKDRLIGLPFRMALKHVARRAAIVVSLGGGLTPVLERITKGSGARVLVIPNAVELPDEPPPYPRESTPLRLLFVGRFAFNKGIDVLLDAARALQQSHPGNVRFLLAGDGPERARMEQDGLPVGVDLLGRVDDAQLERLYADCHALVLPTRFEGMPTVVLEAMARARPFIVSDVGASAELVKDQDGILVTPGDAAGLRAAVEDLLRMSVGQRAAMGLAGRALAEREFSWPRIAARFAGLAKQIGA